MGTRVPSEPIVRTILAAGVVLLAGLGAAGLPARADGPTLYVNEAAVVTLKTGGGGFTPAQRAAAAADAIKSATDFEVVRTKEGTYFIISIGGKKVLTIDATEARAHKKSADVLSRDIAGRIQKALDSVGFVVSAKKLWLPIGGTASLDVIGPLAGKTQVRFGAGSPVKVEQKDGTITVTAETAGEYTMTVAYGQRSETVLVNVMLPAAVVGVPNVAVVAGRPADKATVAIAAVRSVLTAISAPKDAVVAIEALVAPELVPSQKGTARVKATVRAPGRYPVEQEFEVELRNDGMLEERVEELWYSNHPETILQLGRLYWGRVQSGRAARVLYHHQNATGAPIEVKYALVNTQDVSARVAVTLGDAPVHENPTYAGYLAGEAFFPKWVRGAAAVIEVPPHSVVPLVWKTLRNGETASGLLALHAIEGSAIFMGDAIASRLGRPEGNFADTMPVESLADSPINLVGQSQHVYSPAEKSLKLEYAVGGRWGYIRIGQEPIQRVDQGGGLDGNFGVVYKVECTLSNPTSEEVEVEFLFESSAGYTGAFFRLNEVVYRTPLLQPKTTHQFYKVKLAPGEKKTCFLETMPLSGGSYPSTVTIKPVGVG